jgi:sulfonate transport system substrate-binding protein
MRTVQPVPVRDRLTLLLKGLLAATALLLASCASTPRPLSGDDAPLAPIRVAGARFIELSPVLVATQGFYPQPLEVASGGVASITRGDTDVATNAETQLLRESVTNPDLRIIMTVSESFYRLVARRSAGISSLRDLKGKHVLVPRLTSSHYYLVAMLRSVGLDEDDVTIVASASQPPAAGQGAPAPAAASPGPRPPRRFTGAEALARGAVDVIVTFEPEPEAAVRMLGDDAIVLQDRRVYREAFNLHARATDLADPDKRRAIVRFVRAVADASAALKKDPEAWLPYLAGILPMSVEQIRWGWPETGFPVHIIPDMLDVLETEEAWLASVSNRPARSREELAKFIDRSVVEEALALR